MTFIRRSATFCSPFIRSTGTSSNFRPFSVSVVRTRCAHVDCVEPCRRMTPFEPYETHARGPGRALVVFLRALWPKTFLKCSCLVLRRKKSENGTVASTTYRCSGEFASSSRFAGVRYMTSVAIVDPLHSQRVKKEGRKSPCHTNKSSEWGEKGKLSVALRHAGRI